MLYLTQIFLFTPMILVCLLFIYLFSLMSPPGLFIWGYRFPFYFLLTLSIIHYFIYYINMIFQNKISRLILAISFVLTSSIVIFLFLFIFLSTFNYNGVIFNKKLIKPGDNLSFTNNLKIAISSDPHLFNNPNSNYTKEILKTIEKNNYDAFFILGDIVNYGFNKKEWNEAINILNDNINNVPICVLLGNHDSLFGGEFIFEKIFKAKIIEKNNTSVLDRYNYKITAGTNIHIFVLNLLYADEKFDEKHEKWLINELKRIPKDDIKIILSHSFFYSSGYIDKQTKMKWYDNERNILRFKRIFDYFNVNLVVSGHNHYMEFLKVSNTSYAVTGAMGGLPDPLPSYISPYSLWFKREIYGFCEININNNKREILFKDYTGKPLTNFLF